MALTIGEAHDVNTLLDWMLGIRRPGSEMTDDELMAEAKQSAARLAGKANKALMAGLRTEDVLAAWDQVEACPWREVEP